MSERRFLVDALPPRGGLVTLGSGARRHANVLRLVVGDAVVLFDGDGQESSATIASMTDQEIVCHVEPPTQRALAGPRLVLLLAIPKGVKLDNCVRMATELGVHEIALALTEHTVPRWVPSRAAAKVDRLTRLAGEAARQCERSDVPVIHPPQSLGAWLTAFPPWAAGFVFSARGSGRLQAFDAPPEQVWCAIGPEGGFSEAELGDFERAGFSCVTLRAPVLRVETAVPAALSLMRDRLGDLGQAR